MVHHLQYQLGCICAIKLGCIGGKSAVNDVGSIVECPECTISSCMCNQNTNKSLPKLNYQIQYSIWLNSTVVVLFKTLFINVNVISFCCSITYKNNIIVKYTIILLLLLLLTLNKYVYQM